MYTYFYFLYIFFITAWEYLQAADWQPRRHRHFHEMYQVAVRSILAKIERREIILRFVKLIKMIRLVS